MIAQAEHPAPKTNTGTTLYAGMALIVVSVLFLMRDQRSASFIVQMLTALVAPVFFYIVGGLSMRYLRAPLASPGLVTTGAWLLVVGLIHLHTQRDLLPGSAPNFYWSIASVLVAVIVTLTGRYIQFALLYPLAPLVQINAMWAVMGVIGVPLTWIPALSFALVIAWWEIPSRTGRMGDVWHHTYKTSAVLLTLFLFIFSYWLPAPTDQVVLATWGAGGLMLIALGLRYGVVSMIPLGIVIGAFALAWGLPITLWSVSWLALAVVTIAFIERLNGQKRNESTAKAMEFSMALAIALSGAAAVFAAAGGVFGAQLHPLAITAVLLVSGGQLLWLGWRRQKTFASHLGLWLTAAGWATFYFDWLGSTQAFGLWLALMAAAALLIERLMRSHHAAKPKSSFTVYDAVVQYPLADLAIGLSVMILIWTANNINAAPPLLITVTLLVTCGVWMISGLFYRLPALIHVALWVAPLPVALLLMYLNPAIWSLPLMGMEWQILAVIYLVIAAALTKRLPSLRLPFYLAGFAYLAFGLTLSLHSPIWLPVSLGIVVIVCLIKAALIATDNDPVWSFAAAKVISPDKRPYAYQALEDLFLLMGAWLAVIWLQLMLGYTNLSMPQQGMTLVILSGAWFTLGRVITQVWRISGWMVYSAGWLMWLIGLLQVFFSPSEAIIATIVGLVVCAEALSRSRASYWMPLAVMQVVFITLQGARLLSLEPASLLWGVVLVVTLGGMVLDRSKDIQRHRIGRLTAATSTGIAVILFALNYPLASSGIFGLLAIISAALLIYKRWEFLLLFNAVFLSWIYLGAIAVYWRSAWLEPIGGAAATFGLLALLNVVLAWWLGARHAPKASRRAAPILALVMVFIALAVTANSSALFPLNWESARVTLSAAGFVLALAIIVGIKRAIRTPRPFRRAARRLVWWIRPLLIFSQALTLGGAWVLLSASTAHAWSINSMRPITFGWMIAALLLTIYAVVAYRLLKHPLWSAVALVSGGVVWFAFVSGFIAANGGLDDHMMLITLPIGIVLLWAAKDNWMHLEKPKLLEWLAIILLVGGAAQYWMFVNLTRDLSGEWIAPVPMALHIIGLTAYGWLTRRGLPFGIGVFFIGAALVFGVARVNIWLMPLFAGGGLITLSLIKETRRDWLDSARTAYRTHWSR